MQGFCMWASKMEMIKTMCSVNGGSVSANLSAFLFFSLLISCLSGYGQLPKGELNSRGVRMEVPLHSTEKEILVNAKLKGDTVTFLLDTGAPFFISSAIQQTYNFPVLFKANLSDASGKKNETIVVAVDSLTIGPFSFTDVWAVVINMDNEAHGCHKFVGNFGSNLLNFLIVQFDFEKRAVFLAEDISLLDHQPSTFQPATLNMQRDFQFPISVQDRIIDTVQFDSGDGSLLEISKRALTKLLQKDSGIVVKKGFGITGIGSLGIPEPSTQYVIKANLSFAKSTIRDAICNNTYAEKSRIGRGVFDYGRLTLDYPNHRYSFEAYTRPMHSDRSDFGFTLLTNGNHVYTGTVWEGSEAMRRGLYSGCEIIQINEIQINDLIPCGIEEVLSQSRNKNMIQLVFLDKLGKPRQINVKKVAYASALEN
jgi:hypothetical protein